MSECGMTPDGVCMLAGTEFCDFECAQRIFWEEISEACHGCGVPFDQCECEQDVRLKDGSDDVE